MSRITICESSVDVDPDDAIASGLRLWTGDAQLLADDAVQERRFSDVRFSDDRDDSRSWHSWKLVR